MCHHPVRGNIRNAFCSSLATMPVIQEQVTTRSLDFANQRKAYILRTVHGKSYEAIAAEVLTLAGGHPVWGTVRNVCKRFSLRKGCRPLRHHRCGRKPWKFTPEVQRFVLKKLLGCRMTQLVTSASLARDVAARFGVAVEASTVRMFLKQRGYSWLRRGQKRKYGPEDREARLRFARSVVRLSKQELQSKFAMSLDGVVLSMPPAHETDRFNYCWSGVHRMWRKPGETKVPLLAGGGGYEKQVPLARAVPLWGAISPVGFEAVLWHKEKKVNHQEWANAVRIGKLSAALRKLNPRRRRGPWHVLCDNEAFLRHRACLRAYASRNIHLWGVPPRSPDLNPIEMCWSWLRRQLNAMGLQDLKHKRPVLGKAAYTARVRGLLRSRKAQGVAGRCANKFRNSCIQVIKNKGAAAGN